MLAVTDLHFVTGYSERCRQNNVMRRAVCAFHIKNKLQKLSSGRCGAVVMFQPTMRYADAFTVFL